MKKTTRSFISALVILVAGIQINTGYAVESVAGPGVADTVVEIEGISISGNRELPNTLNIVPWRATQKLSGISLTAPELSGHQALEPISRDEFVRKVDYYYWLNPEPEQASP